MSNVSNELLLKQYSHLKALGDSHSEKDVAANVRKHLKSTFPSTKFGVRSAIGQIKVTWEDGATAPDVDKALSVFVKGSFNTHNDDAWDTKSTAFTNVFGGVKMIITTRDYSFEHIKQAVEHVKGMFKGEYAELTPENYKSGNLIDLYPEDSEESCSALVRNHMYHNSFY